MNKNILCAKVFLGICAIVQYSTAEEVAITIESIRCLKTETITGPDKTYYVVSPESGKGVTSNIRELNDNQVWSVNKEVLKVKRGQKVGITIWDGDRFYNKNKDKIATAVGTAIGALGTTLAGGTDGAAAVKAGQALAVAVVKNLEDPDDLVLSAVIDTAQDRFYVLHERRGFSRTGSESFYGVTIRVGNPKKQEYQLTLKSIKCIRQEDNIGSDHPYIKVGGKKVWGPKRMKKGDTRSLGDLKVSFTDTDMIELWEEDDLDPDDHLGTNAIVDGTLVGAGDVKFTFKEDDAHYFIMGEVQSP